MAPGLGFEPRLCDPETHVLPLHNPGKKQHADYIKKEYKTQVSNIITFILSITLLVSYVY